MSVSNWEPINRKAKDIVNDIKTNKITVPLYQRGQVWDKKKEEKLIESIKLGYPFGSILLYKKNENEYHLIDGLQRCTTLYRYIENPARFFDENLDVDEHVVNKIYSFVGSSGDENAIKEKIKNLIKDWVKENHRSMEEINNIRSNKCAEKIIDTFPSIGQIGDSNYRKLDDILNSMFLKYKEECKKIYECLVPTIEYKGDESLLPEIFSRINTKGVILNKYQILAATWTTKSYKIINDTLSPISTFVSRFYSSIVSEGFSLSNYNENDFIENKTVNLYQLIFGFGKLLTQKYPFLFGEYNENKNVESCGFNLVNACLANRNTELSNLSNIIDKCLDSDEKINTFLCNILGCAEDINKILKPYIQFKLNSRSDKIVTYHTEMQICSAISNMFVYRYLNITTGDNDEIISRKVNLNNSNTNWDHFKSTFKKNFIKVYITDMLNEKWSGTGDKTLDEISINSDYYIKEISKEDFISTLDIWFKNSNESKQEYKKVAGVSGQEKLLLSLIYLNKFTAQDQLDASKYDIEHLCPKKMLEHMLDPFNGAKKLPISSFGNLCLLPEWDNRKKKDKTLYQDEKYLDAIKEKLSIIETKYSFTSSSSMTWTNNTYADYSELQYNYINFINNRYKLQKNEIIKTLFD